MKLSLVERVPKPWGHEIIFARSKKYVGKIIVIEKGHRLSLQFHRRKHESLMVLRGRLKLLLGKKTRAVGPGSAFTIPPNTIHRFGATKWRVTLIEVSTPELQDVVRLQDDYGRRDK
ncbi:MAG: cupin domain-containing protein [Elusimicrobiota bacterium]